MSERSDPPAPGVIVVEDEKLIRRFVRAALEDEGCRVVEAGTSAQGLLECATHKPDLVVLDLGLPDGNGIELIGELRHADPGMGILVISAWSTEDAILSALRAGANGYVLKERDDLEVTLSIRSVLRGGAPIDPFIARRIIAELQPPAGQVPHKEIPPESALSTREIQILRLVADGMTNREIAERVSLSRFTVDTHIKRIYRKLAVSSRVTAVQEAKARGWIV